MPAIAFPLQWTIAPESRGKAARTFAFEASASELDALRRYVDVEDLCTFKALVQTVPLIDGKVRVSGTFEASLVQASVINLESVSTAISDSFSVEYWPAQLIRDETSEIVDLDSDPPEALDASGALPIGALLSELLALSVDPYPRNEDDTLEWDRAAGEDQGGPFAALASLKTSDSSAGE